MSDHTQHGPLLYACGDAVRQALSLKSDPDLLERLELAARKPEEMERSGWYAGKEQDPWQPGVYEVDWDSKGKWLFAEFVGTSLEHGWRDSWLDDKYEGKRARKPLAAVGLTAAVYRPARWRGITQAQARALGVV